MIRKIAVFLLAAIASGSLFADTIELADSRILEGDFIGSSNGIIVFDNGEGIEAFPEQEVIGLFFSSGVETALELNETGAAAGAAASILPSDESINIQRGTIIETTLAAAPLTVSL